MTDTEHPLLVTVRGEGEDLHEEGRAAIRALDREEPVDQPDRVTFPDEATLAETFDARTLALLRVVAEEEPGSIRETARLADRDVKNVHEELTRLEALGVVRLVEEGQARRPVFPYDGLVIDVPFARPDDEATSSAAP